MCWVCCQHIWSWMRALFWNPFHCWSGQALCIVTAQRGGQCSAIHVVKMVVHSAKGCCTHIHYYGLLCQNEGCFSYDFLLVVEIVLVWYGYIYGLEISLERYLHFEPTWTITDKISGEKAWFSFLTDGYLENSRQ